MTTEIPSATTLPSELRKLSTVIDDKPESFASGDDDIREAALHAARYIFDLTVKSEGTAQPYIADLLSGLSGQDKPQARSQARAVKVAANTIQTPQINNAILQSTPLAFLHVDSMEEDQIWAQLELKTRNVCATVEEVFDSSFMDPMKDGDGPALDGNAMDVDNFGEMDDSDEDAGIDESEEDDQEMGWVMEEEEDDELQIEDEEGAENSGEGSGDEDLGVDVANLRDPSSAEEEEEEEDVLSSQATDGVESPRKTKARSELDDDVFKLDAFNAEIEEAESQRVSQGSLSREEADEEEDGSDEEELIDYFAPVDDLETFDEEDMDNPKGDVSYEDFFGPRPRPQKENRQRPVVTKLKGSKVRFHDEVKVKNIKNQGRGRSLSEMKRLMGRDGDEGEELEEEDDLDAYFGFAGEESDDEEDDDTEADEIETVDGNGREAIARLKNDLFEDEDEGEEGAKAGMSTHQMRMDNIRKQIATLEAENVAEKDWVLRGEVNARGRPKNALLEEDLEFEQITKPIPVVTEDVIQDLEARIKSRIVEGRFDDVVRKRPADDKPFLPSRLFELQDTKSKDSLAQIYEKEYIAAQGGVPLDDRDGKLKKEHETIEKAWESICFKLDALSNAHFTPKQPKAIISTVSNAAAVTLESALPTAHSTSSILAPEEVFAADPSALQARSEMTPAEKRTAHSRARKRKQQQRHRIAQNTEKFASMNGLKNAKGVKEQKEAALKSIVKSGKGVTVIGKKDHHPGNKNKKQAKS